MGRTCTRTTLANTSSGSRPGKRTDGPSASRPSASSCAGGVVAPGTPLRADAYHNVAPQGVVASNKDDAWCAAHMTRPMTFIEAHSAPLDLVVFEGPDGALPARWKGGAFISTHGSWDRMPSTGSKVVWLAAR